MIKLVVGALIIWFIASQLTIDDQIFRADGSVVAGRDLSVDGTVSVQGESAPTAPRALGGEHPPIISRRGPTWRITDSDGTSVEGEALVFAGSASVVDENGETISVPLNAVDLEKAGTDDDGWVEHTLRVKEGLATVYARISLTQYLLAMACILGMYLCGVKRWQVLLRSQGIDATFFQALRLTFIGFFFNNVVPGMTGGDVVKAVMIARESKGRGPDAVSTVIVDRVLGLIVLAALAAVVLLFALDTYGTIAMWVFIMLAVATACILLFLSRRVRKLLRIDKLLNRLPGSEALKRLDRAFLLYRTKKKEMAFCIAISLLSHMFNILSVWFLGVGLGVDAAHGLLEPQFMTYMVVVPIIMIVAAVPVLPGGWGVGEAAFGYFFRTVGVQNLALSIGLSVLHRFSMLLWSLLGGVFLFLSRKEAKEAMRDADAIDE